MRPGRQTTRKLTHLVLVEDDLRNRRLLPASGGGAAVLSRALGTERFLMEKMAQGYEVILRKEGEPELTVTLKD